MLDDDAKKIMYSKFDKDTNFQNIIKNVNQKKSILDCFNML